MRLVDHRRWFDARRVALRGVLVAMALAAWPAAAQTPGGMTIWSFMGVPNPFAINKVDQQSQNPAIAAAAKAKAAKHEVCKKKAALQYLADLGCTPEHPEVMPALMAALDDPDEPVRYEAVKAILKTTEACQSKEQKRQIKKAKSHAEGFEDWKKACHKKVCECIDVLCGKAPPKEHKHKHKEALKGLFGKEDCPNPAEEDCPCADRRGNCCGPEMREKLQKLAYGRDDQGCFLEPSARVREAAGLAVQACNACACGCEPCGTEMNDRVVRELPPADDRETPVDADPPVACPTCGPVPGADQVVRPLPVAEPTIAPEPPDVEVLPEPTPAEPVILPPSVRTEPPLRSVLVAAEPSPSLWLPHDPFMVDAEQGEVREFLAAIQQRIATPAPHRPPYRTASLKPMPAPAAGAAPAQQQAALPPPPPAVPRRPVTPPQQAAPPPKVALVLPRTAASTTDRATARPAEPVPPPAPVAAPPSAPPPAASPRSGFGLGSPIQWVCILVAGVACAVTARYFLAWVADGSEAGAPHSAEDEA